jgi:F-type H+/Na+-transporting ATPase subunit alpha
MMKKKQDAPMSVAEMALSIYAVNNGFFDKVDRKKVVDAEASLQGFAKTSYKQAIDDINAKPELKAHEATLKKICEEWQKTGTF